MWAIVALGVVWFWITGYWFARLLVFLAVSPTLMLLTAQGVHSGMAAFLHIIACAVIGWLIAGLPMYANRNRIKNGQTPIYAS